MRAAGERVIEMAFDDAKPSNLVLTPTLRSLVRKLRKAARYVNGHRNRLTDLPKPSVFTFPLTSLVLEDAMGLGRTVDASPTGNDLCLPAGMGRLLLAFILVAIGVCKCLAAAAPAESASSLDHRIQTAIQGFPGAVSLYAKNLDTGRSYELRADDPVPTASTIKLPIMVELFAQANQGKLDWNQKLTLTDRDKVSGSGVLTELSGGDALPIQDLMHLMIVVSDNTATNLILDRIGGNAVNARMVQVGLKQTAVMRKILQSQPFPNGQPRPDSRTDEGRKPGNDQWGTGRSSPRDMVALLEKLYRGELVSKAACEEMLNVLKRQRDHDGAGRDMNNIVIASKAGALDHLRSDVAIIYSPHGPVAMAITVNKIPEVNYGVDNPGNLLLSTLSAILVEELAPAGPVSPQVTR